MQCKWSLRLKEQGTGVFVFKIEPHLEDNAVKLAARLVEQGSHPLGETHYRAVVNRQLFSVLSYHLLEESCENLMASGSEGLIHPTGVAHAGTTVREAFEECASRRVPGIPFVSDGNKIIGRVSVRHVVKATCMPDHMVHGAHLLGNLIQGLRIPDKMIQTIFAMPVDEFVIPAPAIINSAAPLVKILAIMEQQNTAYVFVVDDSIYRGIITRMFCVDAMLTVPDV
jgi:CBS domain-containing protein